MTSTRSHAQAEATRTDTHVIDVASAANIVFSQLLDVSSWPEVFEPTLHATEISKHDGVQTVQLWALANGRPATWISERHIDAIAGTITFEQTRCAAPVAAMSGTWRVTPAGESHCTVELLHTYRAVDDDPEALAWISRAVELNSTAELAALARTCQQQPGDPATPVSFFDDIVTDADPKLVLEFLADGDRWAERLDHVADVEMTRFDDGLQQLRMTTRTPDGGTHPTASFRLVQEPALLFYKQTLLPGLLSLHTGCWSITPAGEQWRVRSTHTVALRPERITELLGADATVEDAHALVRRNLGNNSRRTLEAAARWSREVAGAR